MTDEEGYRDLMRAKELSPHADLNALLKQALKLLREAKGGKGTADNLRVRCRAHNRLAAENEFGRDYVERRIDERRRERAGRARIDNAKLIDELFLWA